MPSRNRTRALCSWDFSWKPISEFRLFRLGSRSGVDSWLDRFSGIWSAGDSIENCFAGDVGTSPIALIGTRFPSAPVCADWRAPLNFLVGARIFAVSGVFFLLIHSGEEAFSEVDEQVSPMSWTSRCLIFVMGLPLVLSTRFGTTFLLLVSVGVFPGSFPSLIGLSCSFFWVNFTGRPVCVLETWGVVLRLELRYLKNANRVLFILHHQIDPLSRLTNPPPPATTLTQLQLLPSLPHFPFPISTLIPFPMH